MSKLEISPWIETLFSQAVALDQAGRLKNTLYLFERFLYILNSDNTVLLEFRMPDGQSFPEPLSFRANDYDSPKIEAQDGHIIFVRAQGGFERKKSCSVPDMTPEEVRELKMKFRLKDFNTVVIHKDLLGLLEDDLSHVEVSGNKDGLRLLQRNIFTGTVVEIHRQKGKRQLIEGGEGDNIKGSFGPLGLRTRDFQALFAFFDVLTFKFPTSSKAEFSLVEGTVRGVTMKGVLAHCLYDEMGRITESQQED